MKDLNRKENDYIYKTHWYTVQCTEYTLAVGPTKAAREVCNSEPSLFNTIHVQFDCTNN